MGRQIRDDQDPNRHQKHHPLRNIGLVIAQQEGVQEAEDRPVDTVNGGNAVAHGAEPARHASAPFVQVIPQSDQGRAYDQGEYGVQDSQAVIFPAREIVLSQGDHGGEVNDGDRPADGGNQTEERFLILQPLPGTTEGISAHGEYKPAQQREIGVIMGLPQVSHDDVADVRARGHPLKELTGYREDCGNAHHNHGLQIQLLEQSHHQQYHGCKLENIHAEEAVYVIIEARGISADAPMQQAGEYHAEDLQQESQARGLSRAAKHILCAGSAAVCKADTHAEQEYGSRKGAAQHHVQDEIRGIRGDFGIKEFTHDLKSVAKHHKDNGQSLGNIQLSLAAEVDGLIGKATLDHPRQTSVFGFFGEDEGDDREDDQDQLHHAACHRDGDSTLAGVGGHVAIRTLPHLSEGVDPVRIEGGGYRFLKVLVDVGDLGLILLVGGGHQGEDVPVLVVVVARHFPVKVGVFVKHGSVGTVYQGSLKGHTLIDYLVTVDHTVGDGSCQ